KEEQSLAKLDHTHKFSSDWTSNATDHSQAATCEHKTEVSDKTAHTVGEWKTTVEATEETEGKKEHSCSVCSYKEEQSLAKLDHTHKFSSDWTSDATDHWHAATCEHTKEVSGKTAHTFGEWNTTVEATEETEGKKERSCSVCSYKEEQSLAKLDHTHKFSSDWTSDAKDHWHAATCEHAEEVSGKTAHTFGEWKTTVEATEETEGKKERICSVCSYKDEQSLAKLDHTHKFSSDWTSNATDHWHAATCEHTTEVSGKAVHSFCEWTVTKAATCTEKGSRKRTCSVCKYEATEDISAKGHAYSEDWTSDATDHWHAATCEHAEEVSGKAAHSFGDWTVTKEATEEAEGSRARSCTVCRYTATEAIEKLAHTHKFATAWTKDETNHWHAATCEHTTEVSGKAAHTFGDWTVTKLATEEAEGSKERVCTVCNYKEVVDIAKISEDFVLIPAGTFYMGSEKGYSNNKPVHQVTITKSFYMGKYEVTQAEYEKYCSYGSSSPSSSYGDGDNYPAYYVSWYDALVYCNKRSMAEGLTPCYSISGSTDPSKWGTVPTSNNNTWNAVVCNWNANGYRLPTEAEWEYAARAKNNILVSFTYSGTSDVNKLGEYAWYSSNSNSKTHEVGTKKANGFGLYDMSGNVCELCWNWVTDSYDAKTEGGSNPTGTSSGSRRVFRGGNWSDGSDYCAVYLRNGYYLYPYNRGSIFGFRVVRASSK
ncbi:MAG: formylglycine-generating enzyme family protein, partial [Spirochaetia bacterium]|nr:formylglycine-generating enzyme family protein [Spirochaetia bacterium]